MTTVRPTGTPLITVLGARPHAGRALVHALQMRLDAQQVTVSHLPCLSPPPQWRADLARSTLVLLCAASGRPDAREASIDDHLRRELLAARATFCVIHGEGQAAQQRAWEALCVALGWAASTGAEPHMRPAAPLARWRDACETCSDAGCEHRLFTGLLAQRAAVDRVA